jgi:hypothetical protein
MSPKVLVLGHGWRMWNQKMLPRNAPMELTEWNELVQTVSNPKKVLTFIDFCESEEPDILENLANDWTIHLVGKEASFDFVIDAVSHLDMHYRKSVNYWKGINCALKTNGIYIGWKESQHIRLKKNEIDEHIKKTYGRLRTQKGIIF